MNQTTKRRLKLSDLLDVEYPACPALSPDGKKGAFVCWKAEPETGKFAPALWKTGLEKMDAAPPFFRFCPPDAPPLLPGRGNPLLPFGQGEQPPGLPALEIRKRRRNPPFFPPPWGQLVLPLGGRHPNRLRGPLLAGREERAGLYPLNRGRTGGVGSGPRPASH